MQRFVLLLSRPPPQLIVVHVYEETFYNKADHFESNESDHTLKRFESKIMEMCSDDGVQSEFTAMPDAGGVS